MSKQRSEQSANRQPRWNVDVADRLAAQCFFIQRLERRTGTSFHRQPGIEIHLTDEGRGRLHVAGQAIDHAARHVMIFPGEAAHELHADPETAYRRTVICFDHTRLASVGREAGVPLLDVRWLDTQPVHHLRLGLSAYTELASLCEQMDNEALLTRTGWQAMGLALLTQIMARLQRWAAAQATLGVHVGPEDGSDLVQLGCAYVQEHLDEDLSLERVAGVLGVSSAHLTRSFRLHVGVPFHQYVLAQRVREACRLMYERPNVSLTRIAMQLGFGSSSSFSRTFRRITGQSPTAYRQQGRRGV
ncbi:helix-turn-helix domain-containing protein [Phycisphaerales bacterium AB-hyl4]|uniref:Helix-turn-helix domain-containing protein n=1 Tax=Natronomicrosphaera hydrolytica TaxID=3242702 RepID=A0ABV4U906_9BACT